MTEPQRFAAGNGSKPDDARPETETQRSMKVLVVDDEKHIRRLSCKILERVGYECGQAGTLAEARKQLAGDAFSLVILDINMPGGSGLDFVTEILTPDRDLAVLMVSGADDPRIAEVAAERGAYGYVVKPFSPNELVISVSNALVRLALERENRAYRGKLEQTIEERTAELRNRLEDLELARAETVRCLAKAVELRDKNTGEHIERIGVLSSALAKQMGTSDVDAELLRLASPMHDVGKIGISDSILLKPGSLTPEEREEMEKHTEIGFRILSESSARMLQMAAVIALSHHERFDGSGYPRGLVGHDIPFEGRVVAVVDVFDALLSNRVYRPAYSLDEAVAIMREGRGSHFDPEVLDALMLSVEEMSSVTNACPEPLRRDIPRGRPLSASCAPA